MIYAVLVLLLSLIYFCQATTYTFGKNCSVDLERIHDHADIFVKYDGEQLHETCNDMSFSGFDEHNPGDEYRVCVTPEYYEDPDCAVTVTYRNSYRGSPLKTYKCDSKPDSRYCGTEKDFLFIDVKLLAVITRDVRFKLKVEAELTFDYNSFVAAVVGGVIGGFLIICIVIGVIIFLTCKRKRSQGQVLNPVNQTEHEVL